MSNAIPQHVAIIMDGNGRWAKKQGLMRVQGHEVGVQRVEEIIRAAQEKGIRYLTLYAFSKENWLRPKEEVSFLMDLLYNYLDRRLSDLLRNNVRFNAIGKLTDLPQKVQEKLARSMEETRNNTGLMVTFAFSYSGRLEITEACRKIAADVAAGRLAVDAIGEKEIADRLYTAGIPDPDLLIRTSGEMRISNFLLWQISYAELYVTEKCWPEFDADEFVKALEAYKKRERRFGLTRPPSVRTP